jgi:hypothetical protein
MLFFEQTNGLQERPKELGIVAAALYLSLGDAGIQ